MTLLYRSFLNWTLHNYGAALALADAGGWQKWFFSGLAFRWLFFNGLFNPLPCSQAIVHGVTLMLVVIGNLIDRLRIGKVVDFIHVHYADVWNGPISMLQI